MSSNGQRRPPRPRIEIVGAAASDAEAAAIAAGLEQFLADTAPAVSTEAPVNPWQRAALHEAIRAKQAVVEPWGESRSWGI